MKSRSRDGLATKGLLTGCESIMGKLDGILRASGRSRKKVKFCWIFRDKFAKKWSISQEFRGIFEASFTKK